MTMSALCHLQQPYEAILDKCIYGKKVLRSPAVFEADAEGNLPGTANYRTQDGSLLSNLVKKPKLVNLNATRHYVAYCIIRMCG